MKSRFCPCLADNIIPISTIALSASPIGESFLYNRRAENANNADIFDCDCPDNSSRIDWLAPACLQKTLSGLNNKVSIILPALKKRRFECTI